MSNKDLYSHLLKLSSTIRERRKRLAGHCVRHKEDDTSKLLLCLMGRLLGVGAGGAPPPPPR